MQIIYLDESGFAQSMPREYGYALIGKGCYGKHDRHAKGAIAGVAFVTLSLFSSSINSDVLYALTQNLLPKLNIDELSSQHLNYRILI
jgi:TRAP-type uncharacterized transport system substrate-binding protein